MFCLPGVPFIPRRSLHARVSWQVLPGVTHLVVPCLQHCSPSRAGDAGQGFPVCLQRAKPCVVSLAQGVQLISLIASLGSVLPREDHELQELVAVCPPLAADSAVTLRWRRTTAGLD